MLDELYLNKATKYFKNWHLQLFQETKSSVYPSFCEGLHIIAFVHHIFSTLLKVNNDDL